MTGVEDFPPTCRVSSAQAIAGTLAILWMALLAECAPLAAQTTGLSPGALDDPISNFERPPVIVIPGVLGSRLVGNRSGEVVWGRYDRIHFFKTRIRDLSQLALPMDPGRQLHELHDTVRQDGTLASLQIKVFGVPVELKAYQGILSALAVGGYRDPDLSPARNSPFAEDHFSCFQFAYDWRRDISENAARLDQFIHQKRQIVQAEYRRRYGQERPDLKFDIVAHSLGGLLARYYLRYGDQPIVSGRPPRLTWSGARNVRKAILVGTPNGGSTFAAEDLVKGHQLSRFLPYYPPAVLGTMPSIYQMLPRPDDGRVIDPNTGLPVNFYDEQTWQTRNWGLANRDRSSDLKELLPSIASAEVRATIASNHLKKCLIQAKAFHQAIDRPAEPPAGTTLHLIVGTADKTPSVLYADSRRDRLRAAFTAPGDNTTTVRSAVGPMWCGKPVIAWTTIDGVDAEHREMTSDPRFTETMLDLLLDSRRVASPNVHLP